MSTGMRSVRGVAARCGCLIRVGDYLTCGRAGGLKPAALSLARLGGWSLLLALHVLGCREPAPPETDIVRDVAQRGPLKFTVTVRPKQVWLGDPIEIALHASTPEDYEVQLPAAEDLGALKVRAVDEPDPRPAPEGGLDWWRTFTVESYTSGRLEIPPLVVKYVRRPAGADTQPVFANELVTGTLEIEVRSALTTQDSVMQPRDITGTLIPPRPRRAWPWIALAAALVVAAAVLVSLAWWVRRLRGRGPAPILPEVWALRMLGLLRVDEVESGGAREFYYELSEIVRAYVEKKFALSAPDMTTEEFLATLARDQTTLPYDADRLRAFLEACDIVKYAAYRPRQQDAAQALGTARAFVNQTAAAAARQRATHVGPAGGPSGELTAETPSGGQAA